MEGDFTLVRTFISLSWFGVGFFFGIQGNACIWDMYTPVSIYWKGTSTYLLHSPLDRWRGLLRTQAKYKTTQPPFTSHRI